MNQQNGTKLNHNNNQALKSPPVATQLSEVTINHPNGNGNGTHTHGNGNGNGNHNGSQANGHASFDRHVILKQPNHWSHSILWGIIGVTTFGVIWASVAKIEQAVPAQGKLEPQGAVQEIQAPVAGVVKEIYVKDGHSVKKGDVLLRLDPTADNAKLASLTKVRAALVKENQFYREVLSNADRVSVSELSTSRLGLAPEIASLTKSRKALIEENQLYRTLLGGDTQGNSLSPEQRARLRIVTAELNSRIAANQLEVGQLNRQLNQNQVQLDNSQSRFKVEEGILNEIEPLAEEGAVPRIQHLRQRQEVKTRQAEVSQLIQEEQRLQLKVGQAKQQLANTLAASQKDLTDRIATNDKQLAEIDSQLNKIIVENEKKIAEIDSQLSQTQLNLNYQELRAPVAGTVFDLKPGGTGFVTNSTEPILKIVPDDALIAKVDITNKDIGFIREGMAVDVRIDSFPFSEFGDVKGTVKTIGSDALPPDQIHPYYRFPTEIQLKQQFISVNGRKVPLQSGMSISSNIRVRDRTVLSIFTDLFAKNADSFKTVR
jgi:multidrug efflux pump subunit AcrA (membrane-fusion protein)